jgi:uncharacterized membrane protein
MPTDRRLELAQWLILAGIVLVTLWAWPRVPDQVPVHWNAAGQIDRYGGKAEGLLLVPALAFGFYALFLVLPRLDPGRASYARFGRAYGIIRVAFLALMAVVQVVIVAAALGSPVNTSRIIIVAVGGLFALLGSVLGQIRPNWFVGIRTPWTLSSVRSWDATHRLGGRVFVAVGLAAALVGLARPEWGFWALMLGMAVGVTAIIVYSYRVWRADPDKVPPPGAPNGRPG